MYVRILLCNSTIFHSVYCRFVRLSRRIQLRRAILGGLRHRCRTILVRNTHANVLINSTSRIENGKIAYNTGGDYSRFHLSTCL